MKHAEFQTVTRLLFEGYNLQDACAKVGVTRQGYWYHKKKFENEYCAHVKIERFKGKYTLRLSRAILQLSGFRDEEIEDGVPIYLKILPGVDCIILMKDKERYLAQ